MTATQAEFAATDAGIPVVSQEPSLTVGPSALDRLLARGRMRATLAMLGPAFVTSVAYVDPGNFATNIQGGAQYGYLLLWVVLSWRPGSIPPAPWCSARSCCPSGSRSRSCPSSC